MFFNESALLQKLDFAHTWLLNRYAAGAHSDHDVTFFFELARKTCATADQLDMCRLERRASELDWFWHNKAPRVAVDENAVSAGLMEPARQPLLFCKYYDRPDARPPKPRRPRPPQFRGLRLA